MNETKNINLTLLNAIDKMSKHKERNIMLNKRIRSGEKNKKLYNDVKQQMKDSENLMEELFTTFGDTFKSIFSK